jgi:hypothetical protein
MPPLTKTCPKMVLPIKGVAFCVKDVFAKKFLVPGENSAGGALSSVLRKHSTEGRTPDAVSRRYPLKTGSVRDSGIVVLRLPAIYYLPEFARAGGLMAYSDSLPDTYRLVGVYVGRILKRGEAW